jgi:hypothetical protein
VSERTFDTSGPRATDMMKWGWLGLEHDSFVGQRRNQQHLIKIEESLTVHRLNYKTNGTQEQKE